MSQKSSADSPDIESLQESILVDANNTDIKTCVVEDQDVESQLALRVSSTADETVMEKQLGASQQQHGGSTSYSEDELVSVAFHGCEIVQQLTGKHWEEIPTPERTELPDTTEPERTHELVISIGCNNHEATDMVLKTEYIVRMVMEKDLNGLQAFGGVQGVAKALNSDIANGIPGHEEDLRHRRAAILKHESEAHNRRFIYFLRKSYNSSTILLLLILAILSLAFGIKEKGLRTGWYEGALTLGAVILIVMVHSVCEFRNESSRLLSRNQPWQNQKLEVHVLRGGRPQPIGICDVISGDVVLLEKEDPVPADGLLIPIDTRSLEVNDKADAIINDQNPFLFYGSKVIDGAGKMLVTSVGAETKLGNMSRRAQTSKRTPVEKQLNKLSTMKQIISVVILIIISVVLFLRFNLKKEHQNSGLPDFAGKPHSLKQLHEAIMRVALRPCGMLNMLTSFTLLLVGIAEGLSLTITIAITCWNKRMLGDKTFAQEPSITVTMASVTVICTDKTGGLPLTPQEVETCWIGKEVISEDSKVPTYVREALCDGIGASSLLAENSQTSMDNSILSWAVEKWGLKMETWKQIHSIAKVEQPTHNENIVAALVGKDGGKRRFLETALGKCTQTVSNPSHLLVSKLIKTI
ncbi:calcium-transporting ATPase 12, plasma membrane-type-like [Rhodamnia argentea]|uniref:Calcium-transporting ATPase 12, plasma membrane-type-like n=1 Tax=Rhodamnia argentea TaxID=178133 RepID=A0ABM3H6G8_9MYRT|nr:calcium-transporting ATPase 12, plasma membrane-type-like [Rhodamnia argentea]